MQALDLYGEIQDSLEFEEEIASLYKATLIQLFENKITNLIDIGCGQGEFCNIANLNGITTTGVDLSQTQIKLAKKKFPHLKFHATDIADITQTFDGATATFDVINYIPKDQLLQFMKNISSLLNENGYFIFDINSYYGFSEIAQGSLIIDNKNRFIAIDANYEYDENILTTDITLFEKESKNLYNKQTGTIQQYYYTNEDLQKILHDGGFQVENILNFNLHSEDENDKFIFICKKGE